MYNKLPLKERIELMKSYKKANPDMSYREMVSDYNDSYQKFGNGGYKSEAEYKAHLLDPYSKEKRSAQIEWLKNNKPLPYSQRVNNESTSDNDSWLENAGEIIDPSGISSWDDVHRAYKNNGISKELALESLGAIPLLGKVSKVTKPGIHLTKYTGIDQILKNTLPRNKSLSRAANVASKTGRGTDAIQTALGSKDDSGFTWDLRHGEVPKYNGRNIFPQADLGETGDFKYGGIQQFGNGGKLSYPQKMQAYNDSTILYNSGFNKNIPNPVYEPQFNAAKQRLTLLNNEEPQSTDKRPITTNPDYLQKRSVPYAKPTLPIPPKNNTSLGISKNDRTPIYTSDKNDPRLRAYNDSLATYNLSNKAEKLFNKNSSDPQLQVYNQMADKVAKRTNIKPVTIIAKGVDPMSMQKEWMAKYKKPVQPYIYKKPEEKQVTDSVPKPLVPPVQLFELKPEVVKKDTSNLPKEQFAKLGNQNWISTTVLRDGSHLRTYANGRTEVIPNPKKNTTFN